MKKIIFFLLFCLNTHSFVATGDDYKIKETDTYKYIYTDEHFSLLEDLIPYSQKIEALYNESFDWVLDEQTSLVLASSNNQIANAFATVLPNNLTAFYPGGVALIDHFSAVSWNKLLIAHEVVHLYQLNVKGRPGSIYKSIFGNTPFFLWPTLPFFYLFPSPNLLLPTFFVEGNAVFSESYLENGGRLYSGTERALFLSILKSGKLTTSRMINSHIDFPFTREKYIIGGYFNLFLAKMFGIEKTNRFFKEHGYYHWNPLRINTPFEDNFGFGFYHLFNLFINHYKDLADSQKSDSGEALITSQSLGKVNVIDDKIFVVSTETGKGVRELIKINGESIQRETSSHPYGKLFKLDDGKVYSAASSTVDIDKFIYGLWGENGTRDKNFDSKVVQDILEEKVLYFNARESYDHPILYLNDKKVGSSFSSAILSESGEPVYFKQSGKKRSLYVGEKLIYSYRGYFGYPIYSNGLATYFIGPTQAGASVFKVKDNLVYRLTNSDTVFDAKIVRGKLFLVEFSAESYHLKWAKDLEFEEAPFEYTYFYEKGKEKIEFSDYPAEKTVTEPREYKPLSNLRFNYLTGYLAFAKEAGESVDEFVYLGASWSDSLLQNSIWFDVYSNGEKGQRTTKLSYTNNATKFQWKLSGEYENNVATRDRSEDRDGFISSLGLVYPLLDFYDFLLYTEDYIHHDGVNSSVKMSGSLTLEKKKKELKDLYYSRYYKFSLYSEKNIRTKESSTKAYAGFSYGTTFGANISLEGEFETTNDNTYDMFEDTTLVPHDSLYLISTNGKRMIGVRGAGEFKFQLDHSVYFSVFPLSVRRWAPKAFGNIYNIDHSENRSIKIYGLGADIDILAFHTLPLLVSFDKKWVRGNKSNRIYTLNFTGTF